MKRRRRIAAGLIVIAGISILAAFKVVTQASAQPMTGYSAQTAPVHPRTKTVEIKVTQFTWQLISRQNKKVKCEVIVEHDGSPNFNEAMNYCPIEALQAEIALAPTPKVSATPEAIPMGIDESMLYQYFLWRYKNSFQITRKVSVPLMDMIVNISAPAGKVAAPYVILSAYEPASDYKIVGLRGIINTKINFTCATDHCKVPIVSDSYIEFWAFSSFGDESKHVTATGRVGGRSGAYTVTVTVESSLVSSSDTCATMWGLPQPRTTSWAALPYLPQELNTAQSLDILTGELISVGIVKAKNCPGAGLFPYGSPNGCGMDTARTAVTKWQNQFDPVIWLSARSAGIPARLLKTLIKMETQFWPGTGANTLYEFGLGQLNYLGLDTALRWDSQLFNQLCNNTIYNCVQGYAGMPPDIQSQLKGALMNLVDSSCANCAGGINLAIAQQSIPMLGQALRANCNQTQYIIRNQGFIPVSYDDMWHYTLVSYHSGYQCLSDAVAATHSNQQELNWKNVSSHLLCNGAKDYVDNFWQELMGFTSVVSPEQVGESFGTPVMATQTPIPFPTPIMSKSTLNVLIYLDKNSDGRPELDEMVDGLSAVITFSDGKAITQVISNGKATMDLSSHQVGSHMTVSINNLFYFYEASIPANGNIPITIRLTQPDLPSALP
jgi:hypothetical protein